MTLDDFVLTTAVSVAVALFGAAGCGGDDTPDPPPSVVPNAKAADHACEEWQDDGGKGSVSIDTPDGNVTCVGAED